jgi:enoyl-CoA hydratase/carnithine racemase
LGRSRRFLVDVGQHLGSDARHPALGIAIGSRRVAVDRAEVALPVDQHVAHGEVLRHPHQRLIGRGIAVRMIFTEHFADDARALHVGAVPHVVRLVHREQNASMNRLQPIAYIRQRPPNDYAHRVVEVGAAHLLLETDRQRFFRELIHHSMSGGSRLVDIARFR